VFSVDNGEIVGSGPQKQNKFCSTSRSRRTRPIFEVKITPHGGNSGLQFRSQPPARPRRRAAGGRRRRLVGKLYEESGRGLLSRKKGEAFDGDKFIKKEDWNITRFWPSARRSARRSTATCARTSMTTRSPPRAGSRSGPQRRAMEVRFRNFQLEQNPKFELKTVKQ
jgi:hypothetical protein